MVNSPSTGDDLGAALVAELLSLIFSSSSMTMPSCSVLAVQDLAQPLDQLQRLLVFVDDLLPLEPGQALQAHVQDGLGLALGELEAQPQRLLGLGRGSCRLRISSITSSRWSSAIFRPSRMWRALRPCAARSWCGGRPLAAVVDEVPQHVLDRQQLRPAVDQRQRDHAERALQLRELVQLVEDDVGVLAALELDRPRGCRHGPTRRGCR